MPWQCGQTKPVGCRCCSSQAAHAGSSSRSVKGTSSMLGTIPCTLGPHEPPCHPQLPAGMRGRSVSQGPRLLISAYIANICACLAVSAGYSPLQRLPQSGVLASTWQLRSEEHTSELQSRQYLVCRLLLEKKKKYDYILTSIMTTNVSPYFY